MDIEQEREKLQKLVDEINQKTGNKSISLGKEQQGKGKGNISIKGGNNGTLWVRVATKNYDICLSGKSIEEHKGEMYKFMCNITDKTKHDKYGYPKEDRHPKWETKDFEIVKKAVYRYTGVKDKNMEIEFEKSVFAWVEWFGELREVVNDKNQDTLSALINQVVKDKTQSIIKFATYDPFSFFYFLAQKNTKHQKKQFFQSVDKVFDINAALPDFDNDNCWVFPTPTPNSNALYCSGIKQYKPKLLWDFFQQIMPIKNIVELESKATDNEFVGSFKAILELTNVGVPKLTQTLFLMNPNVFFTIDWILKPISKKLLGSPDEYAEKNIKRLKENIETEGFSAYLKIMQKIQKLFPNKTPYEINYQLWEKGENMDNELQGKIDLLKDKKQIILQGSPGTGKTRVAKEIAYNLITNELLSNDKKERKEQFDSITNSKVITEIDYQEIYRNGLKFIKENQIFKTISTESEFTISKIDSEKENIYIKNRPDSDNISIGKNRIISYIKDKNYQETYGHYSYHQPIAKFINDVLSKELSQIILLKDTKLTASGSSFKITSIESNRVNYSVEGKKFYFLIEDEKLVWNKNQPSLKYFNAIKQKVNNYTKALNSQCKLIQFHPAYSYEDFVRGIVAKTTDKGVMYETQNKVLAEMAEMAEMAEKANDNHEKFVLIIDEINRANLSSVLGELIYALEYRGKAVESMYEYQGSRKITLPKNLYIIGTMNTADRSVGYIDYAIRRRFAFVNIDTDRNIIERKYPANLDLFDEIKKLFDDKLSEEFDKNDVMIGHSYFLNDNLTMAWKYEIKPILLEYLKDGVLTCNKTDITDLDTL